MAGLIRTLTPPRDYIEVQGAAVMVLNILGFRLAPRRRLDPFKIVVKLDRKFAHRAEYPKARALVAELVKLRCEGKEPPHKGGFYY